MSERISLLSEIKNGGYEASLITTFNAFLPFYEDVVLRHLMGNGVRHNVLMMDASQVALEIDRHPPRSAGRYYTLAPIRVNGAFHPKIILLVGKNKGTLLVGSHNLTLSGFGYNREMTNLIYYKDNADLEAASVFSAVWQSIILWAMSQKDLLPSHIVDMINKVKDFAPWIQADEWQVFKNWCVLSSNSNAASLWDQMLAFTKPGPIKRVIINGAFFDSNLSFVEKIREVLSPGELLVGIDPETVQFPVERKLVGVTMVNCSQLGSAEKNEKYSGYLHAKSLFIERTDGETVLAVGSANPSYPAWLAPGATKNIEMMLARKGKDAEDAARELGLLDIPSMKPLTGQELETAKLNWQRKNEIGQTDSKVRVIVAIVTDGVIKFKIPGVSFPPELDCEIMMTSGRFKSQQAHLDRSEYILSLDGLEASATFFRFKLSGYRVTGLIQNVKQIEGLSRTSKQRKFSEALASLTTGMPNLEHFVDCIKDIIKISDKISETKSPQGAPQQKKSGTVKKEQQEGASLSIGIEEVREPVKSGKQRLRGSDDLGYLLDVLLYNLRDENPSGIDAVLEDRDPKGRSEEEQIDADDEEETPEPPQLLPSGKKPPLSLEKSPLVVCHYKVGSLVSVACDKLNDLKKGSLELDQFVIVMAGILSALRLLQGLDGKVPWIGAGQTAVPEKEFSRLFNKIAETVFDGPNSIICLDPQHIKLASADEFARLKGLIVWLAWDSGIDFKSKKPFKESPEERTERIHINRLYVAVAQMIAKDNDIISEARQSIGQFSSSDMDWFEKLLAVDELFYESYSDPSTLQKSSVVQPGNFGFNEKNPKLGVRELLLRGNNQIALLHHFNNQPKYVFQADTIRILPFDLIVSVKSKRRL